MISLAGGSSYAEVLKHHKVKVKPDTLGVKISGIRESRKKEILIKVCPTADGRSKLSSAIREAVGDETSMRKLVTGMEVEVLDLVTTTDVEEVTEIVRSHIVGIDPDSVKVNLTERAFREYLEAYVELTDELAARLIWTELLQPLKPYIICYTSILRFFSNSHPPSELSVHSQVVAIL